jgi:hypothetical protein
VPVGALAGVPVLAPDGSVFGCLCGVDPASGRADLAAALPTIELLGRLLEAEEARCHRYGSVASLVAIDLTS